MYQNLAILAAFAFLYMLAAGWAAGWLTYHAASALGASAFGAAAFLAVPFLTGLGSSGCSGRVRPSRSARRARGVT